MPRSRASSSASRPSRPQCDAVVIVGSDYTDVGSPTELGYNARIAANLGAPVLLVLGGRHAQRRRRDARPRRRRARRRDAPDRRARRSPSCAPRTPSLLAVIVNRADPEHLDEIVAAVAIRDRPDRRMSRSGRSPRTPCSSRRPCARILEAVDGTLRQGRPGAARARGARRRRRRRCRWRTCCRASSRAPSSSSRATAPRCCSPCCMAHASGTFPSLAGIVLNGGFELPEPDRAADRRASTDRCRSSRTELGTYDTARAHHRRPAAASPPTRRASTTPRSPCSSSTSTPRRLLELLDVSRSERRHARSCSSTA